MRYSIVMPYYSRATQLHRTLESFALHYQSRSDYEVVVVEDEKNIFDDKEHAKLMMVVGAFAGRVPVMVVPSHYSDCWNPAPLFNRGVQMTAGDYVVLTSPECLHKSDVLHGLDDEFRKDHLAYVVCACECIRPDGKHHAWYQHSVHRNARYHFCSAMAKELYLAVGGFDAKYALGIGYDDDDFIRRVEHADVKVVVRDDLHVQHQLHPKTHLSLHDYKRRLLLNKEYYTSRWGRKK